MGLVKAVKCKLQVTPEDCEALKQTLLKYSQACNDALALALTDKITNPYTLHRRLYYTLKARYGLTANYVVRAFTRVVGAIKAGRARGRGPGCRPGRGPKLFRPTSLDLDKDLFRLKENGEFWVSLSTIMGRRKIKLAIGNYQRSLLTGQKPTSATLSYHASRKKFYLNVVLATPMPAPNPTGSKGCKGRIVGVDLGIANLATTSNGLKFSGREALHVRRRYSQLRQSLQSKGTRSCKRVLTRLSGRERNWMKNLNHVISRRIVDSLQPGDTIVLENLTHIRERIEVQRKQCLSHHSWAFGQLQEFLTYKALEHGLNVVYVAPHYTSQVCSRCGSMGSRQAHRFSCACGHNNHADYNAAYNLRGASVASPDGLLSISPKVPRPCMQGQADCFSCQ